MFSEFDQTTNFSSETNFVKTALLRLHATIKKSKRVKTTITLGFQHTSSVAQKCVH